MHCLTDWTGASHKHHARLIRHSRKWFHLPQLMIKPSLTFVFKKNEQGVDFGYIDAVLFISYNLLVANLPVVVKLSRGMKEYFTCLLRASIGITGMKLNRGLASIQAV